MHVFTPVSTMPFAIAARTFRARSVYLGGTNGDESGENRENAGDSRNCDDWRDEFRARVSDMDVFVMDPRIPTDASETVDFERWERTATESARAFMFCLPPFGTPGRDETFFQLVRMLEDPERSRERDVVVWCPGDTNEDAECAQYNARNLGIPVHFHPSFERAMQTMIGIMAEW